MKLRMEERISPRSILPGDSLTVSEVRVDNHGKTVSNEVFVTDKIEKSMVINKIVTFDVEKGDFGEDVVDGIGAAFLNVR